MQLAMRCGTPFALDLLHIFVLCFCTHRGSTVNLVFMVSLNKWYYNIIVFCFGIQF